MAAEKKKRTSTQRGMGAVRSDGALGLPSHFDSSEHEVVSGTHGLVCPEASLIKDDDAPLSARATIPAPPSVPPGSKDSGARRRVTMGMEPVPRDKPTDVAATMTLLGRYSSQPDDEVVLPSAPRASARATLRRTQREAVRVDDVGATTVVARKEAVKKTRPVIVDPKRLAQAPLAPREAFLLSLVDGTLTVPDLVDAAGMANADVTAILERLVRLGLVSFSG